MRERARFEPRITGRSAANGASARDSDFLARRHPNGGAATATSPPVRGAPRRMLCHVPRQRADRALIATPIPRRRTVDDGAAADLERELAMLASVRDCLR